MVQPTTIDEYACEPTTDVAALEARLPTAMRPLAQLAFNYWWSWQSGGPGIFRALDPHRWEACGENPVRMLQEIAPAALQRAARDSELTTRITAMASALDRDRSRPFTTIGTATSTRPIAFVCAEYAVHASLPIYAGGLGVLAGDYIKEASDQAVPLVAVGLFYRRGYFHQRLDPSGWQHEAWSVETAEHLPITRAADASGAPLRIRVPIRGRNVLAQIWRVDVGRVPLFLLDTDLPENGPVERWISAQLYVGDSELRLMQYVLLGIGGMRALRALGIDPAIVHLNEGHAALATIELLGEEVRKGATLEAGIAAVRERVVFTTHTPVAAGNEHFDRGLLDRVVDWGAVGVDRDEAFALGRAVGENGGFGTTELALLTSRSANGVSRRHGEVARAMWQPLFGCRSAEETPIRHVTNGVHAPTWIAQPMRDLLARHVGEDWERALGDANRWAAVDGIPDEEIWAVRSALRASLVAYVRARSVGDRLARGEPLDYVEGAERAFDPNVLTLGFARRVASYKRLDLLVESSARALRLLSGERPVQVVIAGKAHPRDDDAKRIVQRVFAFKRAPNASSRVAFLEDYDTHAASILVAGCDVWLNLPRPPLEASGTSGMKAALNGGLNLSVLDGWWCEAWNGANGWSIRSDVGPDDPVQDTRDADALYALLESEVVPSFYARDAKGIPRAWVRRIRASLRSIAPMFSTARMLNDYARNVYAAPRAR